MRIQIYNQQGRPLNETENAYLESLIDKHLVEVLATAEGFAVRAFLVGRILSEYAEMGLTAEEIELALMPLTIKALAQRVGKLTPQERYAIEFAKQKAAENITGMNAEIKKKIKEVIWRNLKERKSPLNVASEMFTKFGELNRDWRRIAITEANIAAGEGYMLRMLIDQKLRDKKETKLLGQSAVDACPWCKANIHGKIFNLIPIEEAPIHKLNDPKWDTALWPGKNNIGRSYSKRKWVVNSDGSKSLVERPNSELAKACFGEHPYGRCWFIPYFDGMPIGEDGYVK